ncbi:NACHT domain-containing protein [Streptomyces sp. NPDC014864]|uniref:NACHT domain-containing protein n=1 Tax=Streptomyces sp. NPDC014864 TaxID=3364924 RepID=UPI0036F8216C
MDYNYESLLDQRFQKLAQALLLKEYRNVQCFPVGMADGGRDGTSAARGQLETVFQVKFTHKPASIKNVAKWITDTLDEELEKISRLKKMGASRYVLITNAFPTATLESGTIDKVNQYLRDKVPMEAYCWWRDDLDRRLDGNYDVKLAYPSILSGPDMLRLLWENMGTREEAQRRKMALSAYFAHQAEQDATIRFKQAELLPSSLLELFIDVPAVPHSPQDEIDVKLLRSYLELLQANERASNAYERDIRRRMTTLIQGSVKPGAKIQSGYLTRLLREAGQTTGAAKVLLDNQFTSQCPYIVLEGAPGQGKSTLSQYLAQLQRLRILDRSEDISKLPDAHTSSPVRMPFKIELRDLASWMKGEDPWSGNPSGRHDRPRTLEGAVSAHVERYSGGFSFDVTDMAFVAQSHPVLIILDALDEVADLEDRHRVVEEVSAAIARLEQGSQNLRVLVTSRPTAVTGAPSFPQSKFDYLTLAPIPPKLGLEYAKKWSKARNLRRADATEISQILQQKMSAPHMAELAKNTMQLSILLSLIYHRGSSLPDKRTELYDAYVDSFFNREVEKSEVVRENRMLLISIHQHLAFYMHARAESNKTTGRIGVGELRDVLKEYLSKQQEPAEILDALLTGMVERVVALVSRVEGTYEFEVQPLREYFAARYLYDTAPYVPATSTGYGTKPDRFDGIAKNPYWMNVTRFFAGCFTKGELLDLAERVCSLCDLPEMVGSVYPRSLALALLQDWVFSQSKPATEKVIDKVYDNYGVRSVYFSDGAAGRQAFPGNSSLSPGLSSETGATHFVESRLGALFLLPHSELVRALAHVMGKQSRREKDRVREEWQNAYRVASSARRIELLQIARWANLFHPDMDRRLFKEEEDLNVLLAMIDSEVGIELIPESKYGEVALASLNQASQFTIYNGGPGAPLTSALAVTRVPLWYYSIRHNYSGVFLGEFAFEESSSSEVVQTLQKIAKPLYSPDARVATDLGIVRDFLSGLDGEFGKSWASTLIGLLSGSVKSPDERGAGADELFSNDHTLCDRVRYARRRGSQVEWWNCQLASAETAQDKELWMATAYCWASAEVLSALFEEIDSVLSDLPIESIERLTELAVSRVSFSQRSLDKVIFPSLWQRQVSIASPTLGLFFDRLGDGPQKDRILTRKAVPGLNPGLSGHFLHYAWSRWIQGCLTDRQIASVNRKFYTPGVFVEQMLEVPSSIDRRALRQAWEMLLNQSERMPDAVLMAAEGELRRMSKRPKPVKRVADREKWFV